MTYFSLKVGIPNLKIKPARLILGMICKRKTQISKILLLIGIVSSLENIPMSYQYINVQKGSYGLLGSQCQGTIIGFENPAIKLKLSDFGNLKALILTDQMITSCSFFNWDFCLKEAKFCKSKRNEPKGRN